MDHEETLEQALVRIRFDDSDRLKHDEEKWNALCDWAATRGLFPANNGTPIDVLGLSTRIMCILESNSIDTVERLTKTSENQLLEMRCCGITTVSQIKAALGNRGLSLRK